MSRDGRGLALRRVEDGIANTVVLLEVDDAAAVPWTSPTDYVVDLNVPTRDLGQLRQNGFFVVFAAAWYGTSPRRCPADKCGPSTRPMAESPSRSVKSARRPWPKRRQLAPSRP